MKNIITNAKQMLRLERIMTPLAVVTLTILSVFAFAAAPFASAWGPQRETFTMEVPATFRTFNSITNNPVIGDERNFVRIREAGVGTFGNEVQLIPGREYEVYIFFHNNAACNFNATGEGIAQNVRMRSQFPSVVRPGERGRISGEITSTNTTPLAVWDYVYVTATSVVSLRYVPASAIIHNNGAANGRILSTNLFSETGTFLGFNELNGIIPGCAEFSGHVIYRLVAEQANFEVTKSVSNYGNRNWREYIHAQPGEVVEFRLTYRNTGQVDQVDVTLFDTLPQGLEFIPGSTRLYNNSNPDGMYVIDGITTTGINIGLYGPGAEATVTYRARVVAHYDLACGITTLRNTVAAITGNGTRYAEARVIVDNDHEDCDETIVPPNIPDELPVTGPLQIIMVITALLAITVGLTYWHNSHVAVQKAVKLSRSGGTTKPKAPKSLTDELTDTDQEGKPTTS